MKIASPTRYEVRASFSDSGFSPMSAAIAGSDVARTVESMFSMNSAQATISGIRTWRFMDRRMVSNGVGGAVDDMALAADAQTARLGRAARNRRRSRGAESSRGKGI